MSGNRSRKPTRSRESAKHNGHAPPPVSPHHSGRSRRSKGRQIEFPNTAIPTPYKERLPEPERPLDSAQLQPQPPPLSQEFPKAQSFTSTIDAQSAADISRKLSHIQELNNALSQLVWDWASFNTPWWSFPISFKRRRELGRCINPEFVQFLSTISLKDERTAMPLLRFAWKAIVSRGIFLVLEPHSLAFRTFSGSGDLVKTQSSRIVRVANDMRDNVDEATYANWRSLTYRFVRESLSGDIEKSVKALSESILLLLFASISLPRQPHRPSYKKLRAQCERKVATILQEATELATMMQEGVLTQEYRPSYPPFGRVVDEKIMNLEDCRDPPLGDEVLCVTQPGLVDGRNHVLAAPSVLTKRTLHGISGTDVPSISFFHKTGLWVDRAVQPIASLFHHTRRDPNFNWP